MTEQRDDAEQRDVATVGRLLHQELAGHQPDVDRIRLRVRTGLRNPSTRRGRRVLGAWGPPALAAGGLAAVAVVVAVLTSSPFGRQQPAAPPAVPAAPPSAVVRVDRVGVTTVVLPDPRGRDWLVAGVDDGDPNQTARDSTQRQLLGVGGSGDPSATVTLPSPFTVRWSDGQRPRRTGSVTSWYSVTAAPGGPASGFDVRAGPSPGRTELVLYVGVGAGAARLEVLAGGRSLSSTTVAATPDGAGAVVTIPLTAADDGEQVIARLLAGDGGSVALAAAVLR
ncbi:MAG: hypothetical protein ACRC35_11175 [Angustibacter sp.]